MGPGLQVGFNHDPEGLPERKLPHGNFATLYIMYESFCKAAGEEPASRTVFYQVGKRWKVCLRFHKPSVHSKCWTCSTLKARIANAIEPCMLCVFIITFFLGDQKQRSATSCRGLAHSWCNIYIIPAIWGLSGAHSPCRWTSFSLQSTVEGQAGLLASAKSLQDGERHDDNDHRFFWSLQADVTAISQPAKP